MGRQDWATREEQRRVPDFSVPAWGAPIHASSVLFRWLLHVVELGTLALLPKDVDVMAGFKYQLLQLRIA